MSAVPEAVRSAAWRVLVERNADTSGCDRWLDRVDPADVELVARFAVEGVSAGG